MYEVPKDKESLSKDTCVCGIWGIKQRDSVLYDVSTDRAVLYMRFQTTRPLFVTRHQTDETVFCMRHQQIRQCRV